MKLLERLREDHHKILKEVDRLSWSWENLQPDKLPGFIFRLWDLVTLLERHEEFEEDHLLMPLGSGVTDAEILNAVESVRREHSDMFNNLANYQRYLSACRRLRIADWTEDKRREIHNVTSRIFGQLREHILKENTDLLLLAAGRLSGTGETVAAPTR